MTSKTYDAAIHTHVNAARRTDTTVLAESVNDYACRIESVADGYVTFTVDAFAFYEPNRGTDPRIVARATDRAGYERITVPVDLCEFYTDLEIEG